MTNILDQQIQYWDEAAKDPDVSNKYIANVDLDSCLSAILDELKTKSFSVLDIGCGIGRLTTPIQDRAPHIQVHGIDVSENMLKLTPPSKVKYKQCSGTKIPYADQSFDSVYSMLVFQHLDDNQMQEYIVEAYRVLKDKGVFRFQFVKGVEHSGAVDHNHLYDDVVRWLTDAGFKITKVDNGLVLPQWTWITGVKK